MTAPAAPAIAAPATRAGRADARSPREAETRSTVRASMCAGMMCGPSVTRARSLINPERLALAAARHAWRRALDPVVPLVGAATFVATRHRLARLRDAHRGQRCFLVGNGPSLRGQDLRVLAGETTFVTNHFYLHDAFAEIAPTYYCVSDAWFFRLGHLPALRAAMRRVQRPTTAFFPSDARLSLPPRPLGGHPVHFLHCRRDDEIWRTGRIEVDVTRPLGTGDTVMLDFCLPLAHFMGFSTVYLVGCDTDFGAGPKAEHFYDAALPARDAEYHRGAWYRHVTASYAVAREAFERSGRRVYNATAGGRLEVFPRVPLERAVAGGAPRP